MKLKKKLLAYHFLMEVSNSDVDSSTNCIFTNNFLIHVNGLQLHPTLMFFYFLVSYNNIVELSIFMISSFKSSNCIHLFHYYFIRFSCFFTTIVFSQAVYNKKKAC